MPTKDYNPCDYGLAAKVWECLRRNEEFKLAIKWLSSAPPQQMIAPDRSSHPLVVRFWTVASRQNLSIGPETLEWRQLPGCLQKILEELVENRRELIPIPSPYKKTSNSYISTVSLDLNRWIGKYGSVWDAHVVVAVPRYIFDPEHLKLLFKELAEMTTVFNKREHLSSEGKAFGARKQWAYFLLNEEFMAAGLSVDMAAKMTAGAVGPRWIDQEIRLNPNSPEAHAAALESTTANVDYVKKCLGVIDRQIDAIWTGIEPLGK